MRHSKFLQWGLPAGIAAVVLSTAVGAMFAGGSADFEALQSHVREEGVDQVADELLKAAEGELEQRIAGTFDMCRPILRAHPEQLWYQLAWRNREGGEEFAKFLGPPAGPVLRMRTPLLKQYSPGLIKSAFGPHDMLTEMRLMDDGEDLLCAFAGSLRVLDADDFSEVKRFNATSRDGSGGLHGAWIGRKPEGDFILSEVPPKDEAFKLASWTPGFNDRLALAPDSSAIVNRSRDGRLVASSVDGSSGQRFLKGYTAPALVDVILIEFIDEGARLLTLDKLGQIALFDWKSGELARPVQLPARGVIACALSDDGRWLAISRQSVAGETGPRIVLWNVADWKLEAEWNDSKTGNILSLAFRGESNEVVSIAYGSDELKIWRAGTAEPVESLEAPAGLDFLQSDRLSGRIFARTKQWGLVELDLDKLPKAAGDVHLGSVRNAALSANEKFAASIDNSGVVMLREVETGKQFERRRMLNPLTTGSPDLPIAFSPEDQSVLTGGFEKGAPVCFKCELNGKQSTLPATDDKVTLPAHLATHFSKDRRIALRLQPRLMPGGRRMLCIEPLSKTRRYGVLDTGKMNLISEFGIALGERDRIIGASGTHVAFNYADRPRELTLVNVENGEPRTLPLSISANQCVINEQGKVVAVYGYGDGTYGIEFVERSDGKPQLVAASEKLRVMAMNRAGTVLFTGSYDGELQVWDVEQARCVQTVSFDSDISAIALGDRVAVIGDVAGKVHFIEYSVESN